MPGGDSVLYTIGHSNHSAETFAGLLKSHGITALADVRSSPYSQYCPQFSREALSEHLWSLGIEYVFLGKELGARPEVPEGYVDGRVDFRVVASTDLFKAGLKRLRTGMQKHRVAIMCAERDPLTCHRTILVCRHFKRISPDIRHILADGSTEEHREAELRLVRLFGIEPTLFQPERTLDDMIDEAYDRQSLKIAYQPEESIEEHVET
ncbi:MAG: DUF488 domain-containing protein [Planctomycetes bacterium]|nr:DUF488 domain-containing protein [Planctomycetota bacterium]